MNFFITLNSKKLKLSVFFVLLMFSNTWLYANPIVDKAYPDVFEIDDTANDAKNFNLNAITYQLHNFHKESDADWVSFSALKAREAIEIITYDPGPNCETVITVYDTDGITELRESRHTSSTGIHLISWPIVSDGTFYVKISNRHKTEQGTVAYGANTTYKLWIYVPVGVIHGRMDGIITNTNTGEPIEGVIIGNVSYKTASALDGFYYMGCPAGDIVVVAEKPGFQNFSTMVDMGEAQRIEMNFSMTPLSSYSSSYDLIQWGMRGSDTYYCLDICDLSGNIYPGLQGIECGEQLNVWSPKNFINITLGVPDSALSGLQFMWKIWSRSGYGGNGFEGVVTVP